VSNQRDVSITTIAVLRLQGRTMSGLFISKVDPLDVTVTCVLAEGTRHCETWHTFGEPEKNAPATIKRAAYGLPPGQITRGTAC
jgi:hypothetical protein